MKHDLFISYSRADSAFVLRLVHDLESRGIDVWLDQADIPPGVNWDDEIEKALDQAKIVIVVLSDASGKSENVKNEIGAALDRGKQIVPVLLGKGVVPLRITRLQREDFSGDYDTALPKLVQRLSGGSKAASLPASQPVSQPIPQPVSQPVPQPTAQPQASLSDSLSPATAGTPPALAAAKSRRNLFIGIGVGVALMAIALAAEEATETEEPETPEAATETEMEPTPPSPVSASDATVPPTAEPTPDQPAPVDPGSTEHARLRPNPRPDPNSPVSPVTPTTYGRGAVLCRDRGFRGECEAIEHSVDLGGHHVGNDTVSSVRLGTCTRVVVCANGGLTSPCASFYEDQPDLSKTRVGDNRASSITCVDEGASGAMLCPEAGYRGECETVMKSEWLGGGAVGNDTVSSLRLNGCAAVKLCSDADFGGECEIFTADQRNLASTQVGTDTASSAECLSSVAPSEPVMQEPEPQAPTTEDPGEVQ